MGGITRGFPMRRFELSPVVKELALDGYTKAAAEKLCSDYPDATKDEAFHNVSRFLDDSNWGRHSTGSSLFSI